MVTKITSAEALMQAMKLHRSGRLAEAESLYHKILAHAPKHAQALSYLGFLEQKTGRGGGLERMAQALKIEPEASQLWFNYAKALEQAGRKSEAETAIRKAIGLEPEFFDAQMMLAGMLKRSKRLAEAIGCYRRAAAVRPDSYGAQLALGGALNEAREHDKALAALEQARKLKPDSVEAHLQLGLAEVRMNRTKEGIRSFDQAFKLKPGHPAAAWYGFFSLPIIYESRDEILEWRSRWLANLEKIEDRLNLSNANNIKLALWAVGSLTHFYLNYQGENDRELQERYGRLVSRVVAAAYPGYMEAPKPNPHAGRVRVGLVSHFFRLHSIAKTHGAWGTKLDRDAFEVFMIHTGEPKDKVSDALAEGCEHFFHRPLARSPLDREHLKFIRSLKLDVLIYPDIGMAPAYQILGAMRLAPLQGNGLGHPVTSGLPAIDVALSSDAMEPDGADAHYSERLVRLAHLGFCYDHGPASRSRGKFPRDDGRLTYVCAQNLSKILPDEDRLFARIAAAVPDSEFWFISSHSGEVSERFRARLERAFVAAGTEGGDRIKMLARLDQQKFFAMYRAADVALDSHGWSGCNTTFEALACGLPVVTWPGEMMRARHSFAILSQIGLTETIAASADEYVDIAVRLGRDEAWRLEVVDKLTRRRDEAFNDPAPIRSLEEFLLESRDR
jgi:predicted O-linked N-acetylglucosamine transferase (SPINDLY family)